MHEDLARGSNPAKEDQMRTLPIVTAVAALTIVTAAVAQQATTTPPTNQADCEKAKMKWDEKGGKDGKGACIAATPTAQPPKK
jgi:hypothetical protein